MSGAEAESGLARDIYLKLINMYQETDFEVLTVAVGSPEAFLYTDEYLAIECEDRNPVVFLDGVKVVNGTHDVEEIAEKIEVFITS